jgi:hypothetical protein
MSIDVLMLAQYIYSNLKYPQEAKKYEIEIAAQWDVCRMILKHSSPGLCGIEQNV